MKLNLLLASDAVRSGYMNIDALAAEGDTRKMRGDIFDLAYLVDAGEVSEIVAHDVLDYVSHGRVKTIIDNWTSRLARGATISISVIDVMQVAKGMLDYQLTTEEINEILYGRQTADWEYRRSSFTLASLVDLLKSRGLKIVKTLTANYRACVTAERP